MVLLNGDFAPVSYSCIKSEYTRHSSIMLIKLYRNLPNNVPCYLRNITFGLSSTVRKQFSSMDKNNSTEERKVNVDGVNINYLKVGTGEHPVLLLPGVMGSIWTDFKPQVEGLDRKKFTLIACDPPGYGKSRPPERTFPDDYFQRDAIWTCNLMKQLGYKKFSLLGWSDGGNTSLFFAAMFPDNVRKMVAIAPQSYITQEEIDIYKKYRNIDSWSEKMRAPMLKVYDEEYFQRIWSDWVDATARIYEKQNGDLSTKYLAKIKCPTLIVYGKKDVMVDPQHADYLKDHIAGAKLKIFEEGGHNLHLRYPEKFNDLVTRFLEE